MYKDEAKILARLEAHEFWDINYLTGICTIRSIEPLCYCCHSFIHSGLLSVSIGKTRSKTEAVYILEHGFKVLQRNNLKGFAPTIDFARSIGARTFDVKPYSIRYNEKLRWEDFRLVFEGVEYLPNFISEEEWREFYKSK